ncbi:putative sulfatase, alkaline phosphatase-like, alpha/beta/alpha [Plasmopara halstedii]
MDKSKLQNFNQIPFEFPQRRFPDLRSLNGSHLSVHVTPSSRLSRYLDFLNQYKRRFHHYVRGITLESYPWIGWFYTYAFVQLFFFVSRYLALKALVNMYGTSDDYRFPIKFLALSLGFLEDFVCTTYFVCALWIFDTLKHETLKKQNMESKGLPLIFQVATFVISWFLFFLLTAPFITDVVLVLYRDMRFSLGLFVTIWHERHFLKNVPISNEELLVAYQTASIVFLITTLFAFGRVRLTWLDLTLWNPLNLVTKFTKIQSGLQYHAVPLEEGTEDEKKVNQLTKRSFKGFAARHRIVAMLLGLVIIPAFVMVLRCICTPLVAYAALNVTLNEFLLHQFEPTQANIKFQTLQNGDPWVENFIDVAEEHQRFGNNTLFRRTTGFHGDLAFNVSIDSKDPPNVVIIAIESFRFRDSRYLVGQDDQSNLFKGTNLTITPNFDKWAKRGVAMRNIWSSIPTSRSLESLLFAQVPYPSMSESGITGGKVDVKLSGLPQLFSQKGYETYFTTGSSITLDAWDIFLPTHGFEQVWDREAMMDLAESNLNISREDWEGAARRGFSWGVHDDITFQLLGDLLVKKRNKQQARMAQGRPKVPTFVTHYTISSHEPFDHWPKWYDEIPKPTFYTMFQDEKKAKQIERYMKVRYFTDMELGKFMDRMDREGILNDTIIVILGDHGQAPEIANANQHEESVTRVPAAIIAEGRLGDAVGLVIDDAAEQYDFLNTLADITGLPEGGFEQNGVGRSLKRKLPFGQRIVFTNDPIRKMAIVRGKQRLRYDAVTDAMMLHDTDRDFFMKTDLLPRLSPEERAEWNDLREDGRRISEYYKKRWDGKCLLTVKCDV